jgi:predicted PurR-regulated permease PerM
MNTAHRTSRLPPPAHRKRHRERDRGTSAWRYILVTLGLIIGAIVAWMTAGMLLLFFAGILLATFLRGLTDWLRTRTGLPDRWSLTIVIASLVALGSLTGWLLAPEIREQTQRLMTEIPRASAHLQTLFEQYPWGKTLFKTSANLQETIWRLPQGLASSVTGLLTGLIVVIFVALYLAAEPKRYLEGLLRLAPQRRRARLRAILVQSGITLQRWLMGQLCLMAINAIVTSVGLSLLGVPMAVSLGILSGLLNFIPNFGPIIAAIPAVLLALVVSPILAAQVALFYFVYQMLDGYVLTPLVQQRAVDLPPALTIIVQVIFGALLGGMGVTFAVPLVAVALVVIKMAYVEDVLRENTTLPGESSPSS